MEREVMAGGREERGRDGGKGGREEGREEGGDLF